jgi:hypothetical protein
MGGFAHRIADEAVDIHTLLLITAALWSAASALPGSRRRGVGRRLPEAAKSAK